MKRGSDKQVYKKFKKKIKNLIKKQNKYKLFFLQSSKYKKF